jgi:dimethylglycine dehydrogenase
MREFQRAKGMGRYQGMAIDVIGPDEIKAKSYPFLETHDLAGALYDPNDGDIDPAQLTQALAKGARDMGARIERFCPVTACAAMGRNGWISTPKGEIRCEYVVNAAGYRAGEVGAMFGRDIADDGDEPPVHAVRRDPRTEGLVEGGRPQAAAAARRRQLLLSAAGKERHEPRPLRAQLPRALGDARRSDARRFFFQLFPDDLERLEWYLERRDGAGADPGTAGLSKVINGPIPYAPDGNPLIGPMPGVPNAFEACVFTFGIARRAARARCWPNG